MSAKKGTKWVFYLGGPEAVPFFSIWSAPWEEGMPSAFGCFVADAVGAHIPKNTYRQADPHVSQCISGNTGSNHTALLPLEVDA